jgi:hypothetical protein
MKKRTLYHREYGKERRSNESKTHRRYNLPIPEETYDKIKAIAKENDITQKELYLSLIEIGLENFLKIK